jgi:hypothetical protein
MADVPYFAGLVRTFAVGATLLRPASVRPADPFDSAQPLTGKRQGSGDAGDTDGSPGMPASRVSVFPPRQFPSPAAGGDAREGVGHRPAPSAIGNGTNASAAARTAGEAAREHRVVSQEEEGSFAAAAENRPIDTDPFRVTSVPPAGEAGVPPGAAPTGLEPGRLDALRGEWVANGPGSDPPDVHSGQKPDTVEALRDTAPTARRTRAVHDASQEPRSTAAATATAAAAATATSSVQARSVGSTARAGEAHGGPTALIIPSADVPYPDAAARAPHLADLEPPRSDYGGRPVPTQPLGSVTPAATAGGVTIGTIEVTVLPPQTTSNRAAATPTQTGTSVPRAVAARTGHHLRDGRRRWYGTAQG